MINWENVFKFAMVILVWELVNYLGKVLAPKIRQQRDYLKLRKKHKEYLKAGNVHKWISVLGPEGTEVQVCEATGYVPSKKAYLPLASVRYLKSLTQQDAGFSEFVEKRKSEIAKSHGMSVDKANAVYLDFLNIKREWTVKQIDSFLGELGQQSAKLRESLKEEAEASEDV